MNQNQSAGPASASGAWAAAAVVITISLLSTFTLSKDDDRTDLVSNGQEQDQAFAGEQGLAPSDEFVEGGEAVVDPATGAPVDVGSSSGGTSARSRTRGGATGGAVSGGGTATGGAGSGGGTATGGATSGGGTATGGATSGGGTATGSGATATTVAGGSTGGGDCAKGTNAGATEVGVSSGAIQFAATIVKTGIAKDFLSDAQFGMEAVIQKVNRGGGVCGRLLRVKYDDDGWDPTTGQQIITRYISEKKYFGLAVNPSSEGLRLPIANGDIKNNKFPVVGADGMLIGQYLDPWVWPVAASTASVMHIMAKNAYDRGARSFGIVWESNYRFGKEGSAAFKGTVQRLCAGKAGCGVVSDAPLQGGKSSYSTEANGFVQKCSANPRDLTKCDFIAMLLEPATAAQWVLSGGLGDGEKRPKVGIGAPQPLFIDSFAKNCGKFCANMWVWTSFKPPLFPFDSDPQVAAYKNDLKAVSSSADANNPHVQGAYCGMLLLVDALKKMGAAPTRAKIQATLDATAFTGCASPAIKFSPGNHYAVTSAQAFQAIYNGNTFTAWRYTNSGFVNDPDVGKDIVS